MDVEVTHPLGPGVREVVGDDHLDEIAADDGVALLRPRRPERALLVLHQGPPDVTRLLDETDRLAWLAGRGPAPALLASGRADGGEEAAVVRLAPHATPAGAGHPMGPEAMVQALAGALAELHGLRGEACPLDASPTVLRARAERRVDDIVAATDGPYAGRAPRDLLAVHDTLVTGPAPASAFVHAGLRADRVWFAPDGTVTFTGWHHGGWGDPHIDLAAAAALVTSLHGPALVAPLLAAYGLERIDLARLDAAQLLVHLLS